MTFDRFADESNAKIRLFNSKFHCPDTQGVDAFRYSWANENNYLVPPVYLIPKVLKHLEFFKSKGVLVTPYWTSAAFFPLICNRDNHFPTFVKEAVYIEDGKSCVTQGKNLECFIGSPKFQSGILALKISF